MSIEENPQHSRNSVGSGSVAGLVAATFGVIAALALAFGLPWLQPSAQPGTVLDRYLPLNDGAAVFLALYGPDGALTGRRSANARILPDSRAITTDLRHAYRDAVKRYYDARSPGDISYDDLPDLIARDGARLYELRTRDVGLFPAEGVTETIVIGLRSPAGDIQFGVTDPAHDKDVIYDPPTFVPADIRPGQSWESSGTLGVSTGITYLLHSSVLQPETSSRKGDCIQIATVVTITAQPSYSNTNASQYTYCVGAGLVESRQYTSTDTTLMPVSRMVRVSDNANTAAQYAPATFPPLASISSLIAATNADTATVPFAGDWQLARAGQMLLSSDSGASAIPPVYIPTEPPLVLEASTRGDLVAFDAANGVVAWRFHTSAPIYSPPAFDQARGQIYFGSGDKNVYALDTRGLFVWSFHTSDNVASHPLVISDTVIFGSEDRSVYALDAATGRLRWRAMAGAALVSSAAAAGDVAIIGSDDGAVVALDIATGATRWVFHTGGPVETPVVVVDGVAYIASRNRSLYALDAATGNQSWSADLGAVLHTAPAISADNVYVVDGSYRLNALERASGKRLWSSDGLYVGAPLLIGDQVVAARFDGQVDLLDAAGLRVMTWPNSASAKRTFSLGPTAGGAAAWLTDDSTVLWRLGPHLTESRQVQLKPGWAINLLYDTPFKAVPFLIPPVRYGDRAVLVDRSAAIYMTDPLSGKSTRLGELASGNGTPIIDSVIVSDTLLSSVAGTVYANSLRDGRALWSFSGDDDIYRPPDANDDTVVVMTQHNTKDAVITGTLYAIGLRDGALRWQISLGSFFLAGGPVIRGNVVYLSTPPSAYDLATGARLWQTPPDSLGTQNFPLGVGTPALDESGATLYAAIINEPPSGKGGTGAVLALDAHTGALRWKADLGVDFLNYFGQLWLSGDRVIVPTGDPGGRVVALDTRTGAVAWRYQPPALRYGQITVASGRVWMILQNGHVVILDVETGKPAGQYDELQLDLASLRTIAQRPFVSADGKRAIVALDTRLVGLEVVEEGAQP